MARITFHALLHEENDGSWWAEVKELPGCFASGFSIEELKDALTEAIQLSLPDGVKLDDPEWGPLRPVRDGTPATKHERQMLVCA